MFDCVKSGEYVLTVKRSEFIASSYLIGSRDEAKRISSELRAKHRDARHVCYGYIADGSETTSATTMTANRAAPPASPYIPRSRRLTCGVRS